MTHLITSMARAYVNLGRWVADCPTRDCTSALQLQPRQSGYHCPECMQITTVDWPANADEIMEVLEERVVPNTRNWFPAGHDLALRSGAPHGQTVADLREEHEAHKEA